jgi:hypothetical protein
MRIPFVTAAALAVLAVGAGPAQAAKNPFGYKTAKFKVEVEGVQTNAWNHQHTLQFECDSNSKGEGTEVVRFHSKPKTLTIFKFGDSAPIAMNNPKKPGADIDLIAKITRRGTMDNWGGKICAYGNGDGGETPPAPDCGTKTGTLFTDLKFPSSPKNRVMLEQSLVVPLGPFRNCPGNRGWPGFLDRASGKDVTQKLSSAELFGTDKKHIVILTGRDTQKDAENWSETTIRYSISLTRISAVKG